MDLFAIDNGRRQGFYFRTQDDCDAMQAKLKSMPGLKPNRDAQRMINDQFPLLSLSPAAMPFYVADDATWALFNSGRMDLINRWKSGEAAADLVGEVGR